MDSEITLRMDNWRGGDWDETLNGAHVMRRRGCAMQNKGITLNFSRMLGDFIAGSLRELNYNEMF